jgi:hypothetical protein
VIERAEGGAEFDACVAHVRQAPVRRWRGGRYLCLTVDDHDYWLTHAGAAGWIVNRKPSDRAGWDEQPPPTRDRREIVWHDHERGLLSAEQAEQRLRALDDQEQR